MPKKNNQTRYQMVSGGFTPIIILIAVLVLAAIAGAFYLGTKKGGMNYVPTPSPISYIPSPSPTIYPSSTPNPTTTNPTGKCIISGCNGEVCTEEGKQSGAITVCVWEEKYSCYKDLKCERQTNGRCGFTQTPEFKSCISKFN